jgi:PAS domain S-box-containing protein
MRVQYRLLAVTILLGLIFLAGIFTLQQNQRNQIVAVSLERQTELERLFQRVLQLEEKSIETLAFDYTYWNEMVSFVQTRDPEWAHNILDSSLQSYDINAIWVYNTNMELVYETTDLAGGIAPPIPLSDEALKNLFQDSYLTRFAFRAPDDTIIEVRGATIHPSDDVAHATSARGYFFVGRAWLPIRLDNVKKLTGAEIKITAGKQAAADQNLGDSLLVYYPLVGADGAPLAYVRGEYKSNFLQGFFEAQQHDWLFFSTLGALLLLLLASGFIFWIAIPLRNITVTLSEDNPRRIQPLQKDRGEFGRIARLITEFFEQKEAMVAQIQRQKETETALRHSEQRYRITAEISSDVTYGIYLRSGEATLAEWGTDLMTRMTGYPFDDKPDLNSMVNIIHPDDREKIYDAVRELKSGKSVAMELRILSKDGAVHWVRNKMVPFGNEEGQSGVHVYGAAQDITVQKAAEEAYRSLVDQSPQGLSIVQDKRIVFANPAFARMVGNTRDELVALQTEEIVTRIHPEDENISIHKMKEVMNGKIESANIDMRVRHADGTWRWLELVAEVTEYQNRPALQIAYDDITPRKDAETALVEQREYSDILFNTVSSLILVVDLEGRITGFNPAARQILRHLDLDSQHYFLWDCFNIPAQSPISQPCFAATVARQESIDNADLIFSGNGKRHWLSWSHRYQLDRDGKVTAVVGTAIEITEARMRELQREAVAGIASALRGTTTRKETIQSILTTIIDFMEAHTVSIFSPIPETDEMVIEASQGLLGSELEGVRLSMSASISGDVMRSGKPYFTNDPRQEKRFVLKNIVDRVGPTAWAPLISEDKPIGLLIINRSTPMSQEDLEQFQPVADMAAGAIDRATRSELAQKRIQQLSALQSINLAIGASLDLRLTLNVLAVQMTTQLGVDAVAVFLRNPNTKLLRCAAHNGFRSHVMEAFQLWEGEGQAGRVAMERRSRHLYDPDGITSYFFPADLFTGEDFIAYDAVPLIVKGEVKGVIEAFHRAPYNATGEWLQLLEALALETAIAIDNAELLEKLQRSNQDLKIAYDTTIEGWARSLEQFGIEWGLHSRRVVDLTVKLAQWMGISGNQLTHIRYGALLHDIGKIGVPRSILDKPDKLTSDEWSIVKKHPDHAFTILHDIPFLRPALDIPYRHHERWNGSGYPDGLKGEEIPLAARMFAVVDIFDALTSKRPYGDIWSEEDALEYLRDTAGREVDPKIARAFLEMYPILGRSR